MGQGDRPRKRWLGNGNSRSGLRPSGRPVNQHLLQALSRVPPETAPQCSSESGILTSKTSTFQTDDGGVHVPANVMTAGR